MRPPDATDAFEALADQETLRIAHEFTELQALESESIYILREVAATFASPVMLFSGGKDSRTPDIAAV